VQNFFGVGASPLVMNDLVVVMVGGSPAADQSVAPMQLDRVSPNGSAIVAFDRNTGEQRWRAGDDLASYSSPRAITIDGKTFVLALARGGLLLIDAQTGETKWRVDHRASILESVNGMVPVVRGDEVFISECYQLGSVLLKVDAKKPTVLWSDEANVAINRCDRTGPHRCWSMGFCTDAAVATPRTVISGASIGYPVK
jgi:outer membrane protein assembly factor BamB